MEQEFKFPQTSGLSNLPKIFSPCTFTCLPFFLISDKTPSIKWSEGLEHTQLLDRNRVPTNKPKQTHMHKWATEINVTVLDLKTFVKNKQTNCEIKPVQRCICCQNNMDIETRLLKL